MYFIITFSSKHFLKTLKRGDDAVDGSFIPTLQTSLNSRTMSLRVPLTQYSRPEITLFLICRVIKIKT